MRNLLHAISQGKNRKKKIIRLKAFVKKGKRKKSRFES